jgi:ClpP class serine protease
VRAARQKPIAEVDDKTLILADQAEKALFQMEHEVTDLLARKFAADKAAELAKLLTSGTWTHDFPITYDRGRELGLPVREDMPENVLRLMELYPQPIRRQPSVEYLPLPYRTGSPDSRK